MNLINRNNARLSTKTAMFYSLCCVSGAVLKHKTFKLETMKIDNTDHQESTNPPLLIASVKARFSDENFITNLCLSYRHDYGLLGANERNLIRFECKEWLRAIINNWDNTHTHVFPNVP